MRGLYVYLFSVLSLVLTKKASSLRVCALHQQQKVIGSAHEIDRFDLVEAEIRSAMASKP